MNRELLIKKWLDNELDPQELKAFEALEDHGDLVKLSEGLKHFKAPDYNTEQELQAVLSRLEPAKTDKSPGWVKPLIAIAAILTIFFGVTYYNSTLDTEINTLASE
ncbi:MAG: anti-sigma factor, partial [Flavobacteriaceae bacterium]